MARNPFSDWINRLGSGARSLFRSFTSSGRSENRARKLTKIHASASPAEYRKLSPSELEKAGLSRTSKRYVLTSTTRVTAKTPTVSEKFVRGKRAVVEVGTPLKGSEAPTRLAAGQRPYKTAASETQAERLKETNAALRRARTTETVHDSLGRAYHPSEIMKDRYRNLRRRKLSGEWIENDEWFGMINIAEEIHDPALAQLRQSPSVT